jgi:predicted PurR-regulated permease PerM
MDPIDARLRRPFSALLLVLLLVPFCWMISGFFGTLVFAAAGALMYYPLQVRLERRLSGNAAALVNLLAFVLVVVVPAALLLFLAAREGVTVAEQATRWLGGRLENAPPLSEIEFPAWVPFREELDAAGAELSDVLRRLAGTVGTWAVGTLSRVGQTAAMSLLHGFVAGYFFFYCLKEGPQLARDIVGSLPLASADRDRFLEVCAGVTRSVLRSFLVIGVVQGFFSGLAFALFGIQGAVFWGVVMGLLSVIPFIGPVIVWLPAAVFLVLSGNYWAPLFMAVYFWAFVASIDNVLRPWLVSSDTQMPDVLVLLTTLGGLFTFGGIGLLVGPLLGALLMAAWSVYRRVWEEALDGDDDAGPAALAEALEPEADGPARPPGAGPDGAGPAAAPTSAGAGSGAGAGPVRARRDRRPGA